MKSILGTSALTVFMVSASFAQDAGTMQDEQTTETYQEDTYESTQDGVESQDPQLGQTAPEQQAENKTQIAQEELPAEVSDALEQGEYADWTVAESYEIDEQGEKMYEIHFQTPEGQDEQETFKESGEVVAK